jgi:hypothetical protein
MMRLVVGLLGVWFGEGENGRALACFVFAGGEEGVVVHVLYS